MSRFRLFRHVGTPTPTPTPTPSAVTFDTSIGNGVDTAGFAALPLHAGAKYIYLNSSTGSDSNSGLTALLPKATLSAAVALIVSGNGDQVLVAQGTTYAEGLYHSGSLLSDKSGFSPLYPTVIQSYDAADAANAAKFGRATGSTRPIFTGVPDGNSLAPNLGNPTNYIAIRGLDINPGNVASIQNKIFGTSSGQANYFLFENIRFQYVMLDIELNSTLSQRGFKYIFRNCSFHGQWEPGGDEQAIYTSYTDGLLVEDCAFWHSGWSEAATRASSAASGGPTNKSHPIYTQDNTRNTVIRRSVFIDCAADGGRIKGGGLYQNNLVINCPISVDNGGGNEYTLDAPKGVYNEIAGNVSYGGGTIDGGAGNTWGWHVVNCKPGSSVHHNVLARSGATGLALMVDAAVDAVTNFTYALPCYADFYNNVSYLWSASGNTKAIGTSNTTDLTLIHSTFNNNVWDDPTSGSNTNVGSVSFTNSYTLTSILSAMSYGSLTAAYTDWMNNPDQRGWQLGRSLSLVGYGVSQSLTDLKTTMSVTVGTPDTGMFVGVLDGSALTSSGLPTGVTIDSDGRRWVYDGSGSANSGSCTITETNGVSSHNTTLSWNLYAAPVLSSLSVTPSTTTASATLSTTVGSGNLYWMVTTDANTPDWQHIRVNINQDSVAEPATNVGLAHGSQAISASGSQSISSITGLTHATAYHLYAAQIDANGNASATLAGTFTTT